MVPSVNAQLGFLVKTCAIKELWQSEGLWSQEKKNNEDMVLVRQNETLGVNST